MSLTSEELVFKQWIESAECVNYWRIDPLSQQPKLQRGWGTAQAEYDRIVEKEKKALKEKPHVEK